MGDYPTISPAQRFSAGSIRTPFSPLTGCYARALRNYIDYFYASSAVLFIRICLRLTRQYINDDDTFMNIRRTWIVLRWRWSPTKSHFPCSLTNQTNLPASVGHHKSLFCVGLKLLPYVVSFAWTAVGGLVVAAHNPGHTPR